MMVSLALDPDTFNGTFLEKSHADAQLFQVLMAVFENLCLLVDSKGKIERSYLQYLAALAARPGRAQHISILMTDVLKLKNKRLIPIDVDRPQIDGLLEALSDSGEADALVTKGDKLVAFAAANKIAIEAYDMSDVETKRRKLLAESPAFDTLTIDELRNICSTITRCSPQITIIDKQIGQGNNNFGYLKGLEFLIEAWVRNRRRSTEILCIIITSPKLQPRDGDTEVELSKAAHTNEEYAEKIERNIFRPLIRQFRAQKLRFELNFKSDKSAKILHERFLISNCGRFQFTRGFDLFGRNGVIHRQWIKVHGLELPHGEDCSALPEAIKTRFVN